MSVLKKRAITIFALSIFVIFVAGYLFLSGRTFYATLVADKVGDALRTTGGYDLEIDGLWGNPLTGVDGEGIRIVHDGVELASADHIEMRLIIKRNFAHKNVAKVKLGNYKAQSRTE